MEDDILEPPVPDGCDLRRLVGKNKDYNFVKNLFQAFGRGVKVESILEKSENEFLAEYAKQPAEKDILVEWITHYGLQERFRKPKIPQNENVPLLQEQQQQLSKETTAGLELMAQEFLKKRKTIVLNVATSSAKNDLLEMLNLSEKGASWSKKPSVSEQDGFSWLDSSEDSYENRTAYMDYLNRVLQLPEDRALADVQPERTLLTVELKQEVAEFLKISGTTDVAIAKLDDIQNEAIRNNIEALLELKKPKNLQRKNHAPQAVGEHFGASYLNPRHPVVTVLTDLNTSWTFYWFGRTKESTYAALYKLVLEGEEAVGLAKFMLDNLYNNSCQDKLPTTFLDRLSFEAVLDIVVKKKVKRVLREFDGDDSSSPDQNPWSFSPSGDVNQDPTSGTNAGAYSRSGGTARENNQVTGESGTTPMNMAQKLSLFAPPSNRDVANELDLLDMVDENEQYEIVRSFAAKYIVPFMTGQELENRYEECK